METVRQLGIGLGVVLGCFLLALIAQVYYLLRWRKRNTTPNNREVEKVESNNYVKEFLHRLIFRWNKRFSESDVELGNNNDDDKDLVIKAAAFDESGSVEAELMRLHNLSGPPRFLFTIKEETKEDLESDDGKSTNRSRNRSLSSDVITALDNSSPRLIKSPLQSDYQRHGFNPLFESCIEAEINRLRSSPPPKFKFLRDAEDKLYSRLLMEKRGVQVQIQVQQHCEEELEGSFLGFINNLDHHIPRYPSTASQVLPLSS